MALRYRRTGWVSQLTDVLHDDGSGREFDRFLCHWQGGGPGDFHIRYGPPCVPLAEALAWCRERTQQTFVDGFGTRRWCVGRPSDHFPPLPDDVTSGWSWDEHIAGSWATTVSLNLGFDDYANAAPGFELALRTGPFEVRDVRRDDLGARLTATLVVAAPTEYLAALVASDEARRAATDLEDGLLDEQADCLGVEWLG